MSTTVGPYLEAETAEQTLGEYDPGEAIKPTTVILVWGGDKPERVEADGCSILLPAWNQIADTKRDEATGRGSIFRFPSWAPDGAPIPGTVCISDSLAVGVDNRVKRTFHAEGWWGTFVRVNQPDPNKSTTQIQRGLRRVRKVEHVEKALKDAREAWHSGQVQVWRGIVAAEHARRQKAAALGTAAEPLPENANRLLEEAIAGLAAAKQEKSSVPDDALKAALGIQDATPREPGAPVPPVPRVATPVPSEPILASGHVKSEAALLLEQAKAAGVFLKKDILTGLISNDPAALDTVRALLAEANKGA